MYEKKLLEKRAECMDIMLNIRATAEAEGRAFTDAEEASFKAAEEEVNRIDASLRAIEAAQNLQRGQEQEQPEAEDSEALPTQEDIEIRAFANVIRNRADDNITYTDNGAVIPVTIINRIIDKVKDICPIFADTPKYNIKGTVAIPYVDEDSDNISMAYAEEFTDLEAKGEKLLTINLEDHLAGCLVKISKSLMQSTDLDIVGFVVDKIATSIAEFFEQAALVGDADNITGLSTATQIDTAASSTAITMDELVTLQAKLKTSFQNGAYWIMAPDTFTAVKLLKDTNGRYLLEPDPTSAFGWTLLGKPVYVSDQAPALEAGANAVVYINPKEALAGKMMENSMQVLNEKYATQHAVGIVAWVQAECKVVNQQAVAILQMAAA